jgi:hypothetical protein
MELPGIFIATKDNLEKTLTMMDKATHQWTLRAARGECSWICSDCSVTFKDGMPDECLHGHRGCTDIIKRDKAQASEPSSAAADQDLA